MSSSARSSAPDKRWLISVTRSVTPGSRARACSAISGPITCIRLGVMPSRIVSAALPAKAATSRLARSTMARISRARSSSRAPAGVGAIPRECRTSSAAPSSSSSSRIWVPRAGWATRSCSAARVMLPVSITRTR